MKLTHTTKRKAGMTLLELTVVILVLLSLISILFIGARAWKKGSDRAANILNIRNVQQAVRGHENMRSLAVGNGISMTTLFGDGTAANQGYLKEPQSPVSGITYVGKYLLAVPEVGVLFLDPEYTVTKTDYHPTDTANW